ncbi:hypothetical protein [Methylomonas methanica]|uniref:Uncharacterized protein n=1 Tax=Methylomonas methanica (strain DSM 25384 / MC09) TaxID=857087 RepID=G0A606_METMM|nr:hypothetical protein [Methylomonas methanica]AEG00456.1 hypothetical protein Metme_2050 [Methylomonas methanica MC09]
MKANPGGQIDLSEIIGRDQVVDQLWETLEQQSIRINAERRIGKTTVIKKLCETPKAGWVPIFQDLEQYHSAMDFAQAVYREIDGYLSTKQQSARRAKDFLTAIGGSEIKGVLKLPAFNDQTPWKILLTKSIEDLVEAREQHREKPLLLWDEVPLMLQSIAAREGQTVAMEVLDTLRALRQELGAHGLRMILTGSIGFHHVIDSLKQQGYANSPLNDLYAFELPVLEPPFPQELASKLISGENIQSADVVKAAATIAELSDGFPFYIHHIVKAVKLSGLEATSEGVSQIVTKQLVDSNDPWELTHYRDRIPTYYGNDAENIVLGLLDSVAANIEPVAVADVLRELKSQGLAIDREKLLKLLKAVEQDHYLAKDEQGRYRFRFPLLQRWWKLSRGL